MTSTRESKDKKAPEWVRVVKAPRDVEARGRIVVSLPGQKNADDDLLKAQRELVRVETKALKSLVQSQDLPEFTKRQLLVRLEELEADE